VSGLRNCPKCKIPAVMYQFIIEPEDEGWVSHIQREKDKGMKYRPRCISCGLSEGNYYALRSLAEEKWNEFVEAYKAKEVEIERHRYKSDCCGDTILMDAGATETSGYTCFNCGGCCFDQVKRSKELKAELEESM